MMTQNNKIFLEQYPKKNSFFISIEGNIGAGKSTFLKKITDDLMCPLLLEQCHEW